MGAVIESSAAYRLSLPPVMLRAAGLSVLGWCVAVVGDIEELGGMGRGILVLEASSAVIMSGFILYTVHYNQRVFPCSYLNNFCVSDQTCSAVPFASIVLSSPLEVNSSRTGTVEEV